MIALGLNYLPRVTSFLWIYIVKTLEIFLLFNIRTMTTNFSPLLGVLCFKPIPKYCDVWYEGILHISRWSDMALLLPNFTGMFLRWSYLKFLQIIVFLEEFWKTSKFFFSETARCRAMILGI